MLPPPWVLCWHIRICRVTTHGRICIKLVLVKIFWWNSFCLFAVLQRNPLETKQKTLKQYFIPGMIAPSDEKMKKHQKLSTVGLPFDLNVSSQGVNVFLFCSQKKIYSDSWRSQVEPTKSSSYSKTMSGHDLLLSRIWVWRTQFSYQWAFRWRIRAFCSVITGWLG